jgi:hypothetical protein
MATGAANPIEVKLTSPTAKINKATPTDAAFSRADGPSTLLAATSSVD